MVNIFYVGEIDFDSEVASAVRIVNNCKAMMQNNDIKTTIIGYSHISAFSEDNISVFNVRRERSYPYKFISYLFWAFFVIKLLGRIKEKKDFLIYYGCSTRVLLPLLIYCKIKRIKLIADVVEWFDYETLKFGKYGPSALDVHLCMTTLIPYCDGVIAISRFLRRYFEERGMKTFIVPVLIDTQKELNKIAVPHDLNSQYLNLIYAGFPGKKDLLFNIIEMVERLESEGILIQFHLLGPTKTQLEKLIQRKTGSSIVCHGRIKQSIVPEYLNQADFSVLLRPNKRYAHAGFPTKFVESLNAGLPVIANYTSDLELYLKNGINGFVVEDCSVNALMDKLKYIISLDRNQFQQLSINARQTAIENFDYRLYADKFDQFLSNISGRRISN